MNLDMKNCAHSFWIGVSKYGNGTELVVSDRVRRLLDTTAKPDIETPRLVVLIGNTSKAIALRELFRVKRSPWDCSSPGRSDVHLHLDAVSATHGKPLLIAESGSSEAIRDITHSRCHERRRMPLNPALTPADVYFRVLYPLTEVFCFFCDDLGGLEAVVHYLAARLKYNYKWKTPASLRPSVLIVTESIPTGTASENMLRTKFLKLLYEETAIDIFTLISAVEIVALLPKHAISSDSRHRYLKERLMAASDQMIKNKIDRHHLLSTTHTAALLDNACDHVADATDESFNVIRASRLHNPLEINFKQHILNFMLYIKSSNSLTRFAAPIIASSMVMDNYLPDAHCRLTLCHYLCSSDFIIDFQPEDVFKVLYKPILMTMPRILTLKGSHDVTLRSRFIATVKRHFVKFAMLSFKDSLPTAEIHRNNLIRYKDYWSGVQDYNTCFSCLRLTPQYKLPCNHLFCRNCVQVLGESVEYDPWLFRLSKCFLCQETPPAEVLVRIHPPTAGAGILCIDGGGVKAQVPLEIMKRINSRIDLPIPFQRFFKVAVGISSGGLIISDIFLNGQTIQQSINRFEELAKVVFRRREIRNSPCLPRFARLLLNSLAKRVSPISAMLKVIDLMVSLFSDGLYSPKNLEAALKQVFGTDRNILDISYATFTGTNVGIPVATVDNKPSCRVFTNYNGIGERPKEQGKIRPKIRILGSMRIDQVIRPKNGSKMLLWEIARAACAAPGFFPPKYIPGIGTFQDAGPLENNPSITGLSELATLYPIAEEPDHLLSIGTGEPRQDEYDSTNITRSTWKNGAFPRLCRLFWEKMRDRNVSQAFRAHPRYHRMNIEFEGDEPRLDDTESMSYLKSKVQNDHKLSLQIESLVPHLIASLFYFELESVPEKRNGKYMGSGNIFCSIRHCEPAFKILFERLSCQSAQLLIDGESFTSINDSSCFSNDGNFRKRIDLTTPGKFEITLKQQSLDTCHISGSPFSVDKLILLQGLHAVFGRSDHRKRKTQLYPQASSKKRRVI